MNRAEIKQEFGLSMGPMSEKFKENMRQLRTLIGNKERAYGRLVIGDSTTNRRRRTANKSSSTPSSAPATPET